MSSVFGRSLSFPLRVGADGRLVWSEGEDNIRESIAVILKTEPNERIALADFGAGLSRFLFEPNNAATHARIEDAITRSLATVTYRLVATGGRERISVSVSLGSL